MDRESELSEKIRQFQQLKQENKNVDVAALVENALTEQDGRRVSARAKKWAYLVSLGLPPFGLLFAVRFFFSAEDDARHVAYVCIALTAFSILVTYALLQTMFASSGSSLEQVQQIRPQDIQQLLQ